MSSNHSVQQGEQLSFLAEKYGFHDYEIIWNHPNNAALKKKRIDPHTLYPGDTVFIPDKRPRTVSGATTKLHRFRIKDRPLTLRMVLRDFDHQPLANMNCELEVEGTVYPLTSDGTGGIEAEIPKTARNGKLRIPELEIEFPLQIGHLDPVEEEEGWGARLANLGYHTESLGDDNSDQLRWALEEFQCDHDLPVTGVLNDATRAKLKALHGA